MPPAPPSSPANSHPPSGTTTSPTPRWRTRSAIGCSTTPTNRATRTLTTKGGQARPLTASPRVAPLRSPCVDLSVHHRAIRVFTMTEMRIRVPYRAGARMRHFAQNRVARGPRLGHSPSRNPTNKSPAHRAGTDHRRVLLEGHRERTAAAAQGCAAGGRGRPPGVEGRARLPPALLLACR